MGRTLDQLHACERAICNRFITWRAEQGENLQVILHNQRPVPPDFEIRDAVDNKAWLEVSDVFIDDEDVDWLLSPDWKRRGILEGTDGKFIDRAVAGLRNKLSESSYTDCVKTLGKGVLVLAARYALIDDVVLYDLQQALSAAFIDCADAKAFRVAWLEAQFGGAWYYLEIYPHPNLI